MIKPISGTRDRMKRDIFSNAYLFQTPSRKILSQTQVLQTKQFHVAVPRWSILQTAADLKADINLPRKRSQLSTIQFSWQSCQSFDRSNGNRWDTWRSKYAEINHVGTTWCYACTYAESLQTSVQLGRNSWPGSQLLAARRRAFPSTSLSSPARVFIR